MRFQDLEHFTESDVKAALKRNDVDELQFVSLTIALASSDRTSAQDTCLILSSHSDNKVRGNAVMSLGHLARRFRQLDEAAVKPVIEAALQDADDSVRSHAKSAADEIYQFLGWKIAGHVYG